MQNVNSGGVVRGLADLNVSLQNDGTLVLDQLPHGNTFAEAMAADPSGANKLFTTTKTGIAALVDALVAKQTNPVDGALVGETKQLNNNITSLDGTVAYWQNYLDNERARLTSEFTAMESTVAALNTTANYLNQLFYSSSSNTYKTTSNG
jgi:flagellar capping protein FliD